jgi:hypothetical protein
MKTLRCHLIAAVFRDVLALVFIAAALLKWFDPSGQSTYYGTLAHAAPAVGRAIIVCELLLAAWLITGVRAGLAAGTALFVLALFSGAIVADMLAKHPVPCGCFGAAWAAAHSPAAIEHGLAVGLVRDMALIVLAAAAWMLARRPSQPPASEPSARGSGEAEPQA